MKIIVMRTMIPYSSFSFKASLITIIPYPVVENGKKKLKLIENNIFLGHNSRINFYVLRVIYTATRECR